MQPKKNPTRVLAADPGYERLGLAVLERTAQGGERVVVSLCVRTPKELTLPERIGMLADAVREIIKEHTPDAFAMERIFFNQSTSTALGVAEVRGMLETLAHEHVLPVYQYAPQQVKIAVTGYGASDKGAVARMVTTLLSLPPGKRFDDEIDAIAVGVACLASTRGYPQK